MKKKKLLSLAVCAALAFSAVPYDAVQNVISSDIIARAEGNSTSTGLKCLSLDKTGVVKVSGVYGIESVKIGFNMDSIKDGDTLIVESSNKSVIDIPEWDNVFDLYPGWSDNQEIYVSPVRCGTATITVKLHGESLKIPVVVCERRAEGLTVSNSGLNSVSLNWDKTTGASGYVIKKSTTLTDKELKSEEYPYSKFKTVKYVSGAANCSAKLTQEWGEKATYYVQPYVEYKGNKYISDTDTVSAYWSAAYTKPNTGVSLSGVKKVAAKTLQVSWKNAGSKYSYKLYRSTDENNGYKLVKTVPASTKSTITVNDKVSNGVTYYYKLVTVKGGRVSGKSASVSGFIPISTAKKITKANFLSGITSGQYGWNCSSSDSMYYFAQDGKFNIAELDYDTKSNVNVLKVYTLNNKFKVSKKKTVKLPKNSDFGGFYHAYDGNNYVVVGYFNPKESKTKTVISVIKYSKNWKKLGTANIKGGESNYFEGIYYPFEGGNVRMDLNGTKLYLYTAREMFAIDGVHHQSNIAFEIDTKTMKAKANNINYTSHSFNQFVRFQNGNIYLCDHGDGYDRGVCVTLCKRYGKASMTQDMVVPLEFDGQIGDNYTGATVGGMEVGKTNVVTIGTTIAHKGFKLNGKTGGNTNLYVILTNKNTGKSTVKWLTKYDSKKSKNYVEEARMVKITDDCFAVLYSVKNEKTGKSVFHCMYINNSGKVLKNKVYKSVTFNCGTQPVLYKGFITFADEVYNSKTYSGTRKIFRIPATW